LPVLMASKPESIESKRAVNTYRSAEGYRWGARWHHDALPWSCWRCTLVYLHVSSMV
jgi:hypothetical protein